MTSPDPSLILIVDDHRPTRQSLYLLLTDVGYTCIAAPSVADARLLLRPPNPPPALMIVDLWMPHEDGESLLLWTRAQPHLAGTKVVIYSAAPQSDYERRLLAAGAADFIPKPTPIPRLLSRLSRFARPSPRTLNLSITPIPTPAQ